MFPDLENDITVSSVSYRNVVHVGRGTYWHPTTKFITYIPEEQIIIGRYCSLAEDAVVLTGGEHAKNTVATWPLDNFINRRGNPTLAYRRTADTRIESDVWIGHGAIVFGGCTVGFGAVIGARAVVCKDVPPYAIVVGNPAKTIRYRFEDSVRAALLNIAWWDWEPQLIAERVDWFYKPIEEFVNKFG